MYGFRQLGQNTRLHPQCCLQPLVSSQNGCWTNVNKSWTKYHKHLGARRNCILKFSTRWRDRDGNRSGPGRGRGGLQSPASFCTPSISHHLSFYHLGINHNYSFALEHSPSTKDANTGDSEGKIKYRKETDLCAKKKFTPKIKFCSRKKSCNGQEGRVAGGCAKTTVFLTGLNLWLMFLSLMAGICVYLFRVFTGPITGTAAAPGARRAPHSSARIDL